MIIVRLEQELRLAEQKLGLTIERVQSPSDPEGVRARRTVESLSARFTRIDAALVDEFPTIFDFTAGKSDCAEAAPPPQDGSVSPGLPPAPTQGSASPRAKKSGEPADELAYDESLLADGRERMEWSKRMRENGYISKAQHDRNVQLYQCFVTA